MEPTRKSVGMDAFLSKLAGKDRQATIRANKCMTCDGDALEFDDEKSRREYAISGMCQSCQDEVFK